MLPCRPCAVLALAAHVALGACAAASHRDPVTGTVSDAAATAASGAPLNPPDSALVAALDAFTRARVAADSFSGVVVLAREGVPIYSRAIGLANRATGAPNRLDTRFNLASVDKYFTRIAIRQLQQAGKLRLSDRVGAHLPDYPNARVRDEVTIRHLYEMRSGLGDFDRDDYRTYTERLPDLRTLDDYVALFAADPLEFAPGTKTRYSNAGYVVLGKIVERVSGQRYYDYVQQHVFDAAGMRGTGYVHPDADATIAIGYTTSPSAADDVPPDAPRLPERRPNTRLLGRRGSSAGGGYSTAEDLLRLSRAILEHRLLDATFTDSLLDLRPAPFSFEGWSGGWASGWAGGSAGINTELYLHSTGHTLIVLSNYDPPSATVFRRKLWGEWLPAWIRATAGGR